MAGHQHTGEAGCTHQLPAATAGPGCPGPRYRGTLVPGVGRAGFPLAHVVQEEEEGEAGCFWLWVPLASITVGIPALPGPQSPCWHRHGQPLSGNTLHICAPGQSVTSGSCHPPRHLSDVCRAVPLGKQLFGHTLSPLKVFSFHAVLPFWA